MRRTLPSLNPARTRPWVWALGVSGLVHTALLWPAGSPPWENRPLAADAALQTRALLLPAPTSVLEPIAVTAPARTAKKPLPAAAPAPPAEPAPPPTAIAPAAEWLYLLRQNGKEGIARLSWQPQDGGYQLRLARELEGRKLPGRRSQGALDGQGLAPQASNFRRDEGLISFSASSEQVALPPGVQDRISWWLQLAAIVAGAPQRFGPGSEIRLPVAGLRGEAHEWVFEVLAEEPLPLPQGVVAATLHLRRAALGPYDGGIELWLDPARGHLPVRLLVGRAEERGWELQLLNDKAKP